MDDEDFIKCANCGKVIAECGDEEMVPTFEACYKAGNIPVPNFGWLCSMECAIQFEKSYPTGLSLAKQT